MGAASSVGLETLRVADERLEKGAVKLEIQLKERGEQTLDTLMSSRRKWAGECARREWLCWCRCLLSSRNADLLDTGGRTGTKRRPQEGDIELSMMDIMTSLLTGKASPCVSQSA